MAKKVVLTGPNRVGKTKLLSIALGHEAPESYQATLGVEVYPLKINGQIFNIWDCGAGKTGGLERGYYIGADIVVIFDSPYNAKYIDMVSRDAPFASVRIHGPAGIPTTKQEAIDVFTSLLF